MGGPGSGHGIKRPDHPTGSLLKGKKRDFLRTQRKHLPSVFSGLPDPSCHGHKKERDRLNKLKESQMAAERRKQIAAEARDIQELARRFAQDALQAMVDILDDPDSSGTNKLAAANSLLDRAYGKPAVTVHNTNTNIDAKLSDLDAKSLDQRIAETLNRVEKLTNGEAEAAEGEVRHSNLRKYN